MRIAVVGAGAIGSTYAWHLARSGNDVTIVDVWPEHVTAVAGGGLVGVLPDGRTETASMAAVTDAAGTAAVDFVLVATKAFANLDAARTASQLLGDETLVGTVQNGLGNDRVLGSVIGPERVVPGTTTVGAEMAGPGRVKIAPNVAAGQSLTSFGLPRAAAAMPARVLEACAALDASGLPAEALDDVDYVIWRKLCMAGSMGPLTAALRFTVADVMGDPPALALCRRLIEEIVAVGRACGVAVQLEEMWEHAVETYERVGPHYTSMAVDVIEGRRTEIEAMCCEVARLGRERGVATPVNEVVGELIRSFEQKPGS